MMIHTDSKRGHYNFNFYQFLNLLEKIGKFWPVTYTHSTHTEKVKRKSGREEVEYVRPAEWTRRQVGAIWGMFWQEVMHSFALVVTPVNLCTLLKKDNELYSVVT